MFFLLEWMRLTRPLCSSYMKGKLPDANYLRKFQVYCLKTAFVLFPKWLQGFQGETTASWAPVGLRPHYNNPVPNTTVRQIKHGVSLLHPTPTFFCFSAIPSHAQLSPCECLRIKHSFSELQSTATLTVRDCGCFSVSFYERNSACMVYPCVWQIKSDSQPDDTSSTFVFACCVTRRYVT